MTLAAAALAVCAVSVGLALAQVPPLADSRKTVGLGADARFVPEGALRYLDGIGMTGRLFNAFHFGGYITWRDFPKRAAIIDGRGYVPGSLREEIHFARAYPEHLARLQAAYGFDAAVLDYPVYAGEGIENLGPDADWGLTSPAWALVYWDDFALVYLRRSSRWEPIIARDEYRRLHPANGLPAFWRSLADKAAAPEIKAELERNVSQTNSARGRTLLGFALLQEGKADAALEVFGSVRDPERRLDVLQGQGLAWQQKGDKARGVETYERAVAVQEDALTLYGLGAALIDAGRAKDAIRPLERARAKDPALLPVYGLLIDAYRRSGDSQGAGEVAQAAAAAVKRAQARGTRAERARPQQRRAGARGRDRAGSGVGTRSRQRQDPERSRLRLSLRGAHRRCGAFAAGGPRAEPEPRPGALRPRACAREERRCAGRASGARGVCAPRAPQLSGVASPRGMVRPAAVTALPALFCAVALGRWPREPRPSHSSTSSPSTASTTSASWTSPAGR